LTKPQDKAVLLRQARDKYKQLQGDKDGNKIDSEEANQIVYAHGNLHQLFEPVSESDNDVVHGC